jgi:hypothetical protein
VWGGTVRTYGRRSLRSQRGSEWIVAEWWKSPEQRLPIRGVPLRQWGQVSTFPQPFTGFRSLEKAWTWVSAAMDWKVAAEATLWLASSSWVESLKSESLSSMATTEESLPLSIQWKEGIFDQKHLVKLWTIGLEKNITCWWGYNKVRVSEYAQLLLIKIELALLSYKVKNKSINFYQVINGHKICFWDRISLCSPGWSQTRGLSALLSWMLCLAVIKKIFLYFVFWRYWS